MNFPTFDNEGVEINEGLSVLRELDRKKINIPVVIYSSKYVDISKYENVIDYILYEGYDLMKRVKAIKNKLKGDF